MLIEAPDGAMAAETEEMSRAAAKSAYENQLICKRAFQIGSNIPKRICKTRAQMDRDAEAAKRYSDEMKRNSGWRVPGGRGDPNGGTAERAPGPL